MTPDGLVDPVSVTAPVAADDRSATGLGISVWDTVHRHDRDVGPLLAVLDVPTAVASSLGLAVSLLRWAGHHHRDAHPETSTGVLASPVVPFTEPRLTRRPCGDEPYTACPCDVATASRMLHPTLSGAPVALVNADLADRFRDDPDCRELPAVCSLLDATLLVEAVSHLVQSRWRVDHAAVLEQARRTLLADVA